jgi:hypothetical protein
MGKNNFKFCLFDPAIITKEGNITMKEIISVAGDILAAFYFGYLVTQIPGGWLALHFGAKWVRSESMLFLIRAVLW